MERDCIRRDTRQHNLVDCFFQNVQAGDTQNPVDVTRHDDFQDDWRSLGDQNLVAKLFGANLVICDRTGTAFFAVEAKFVVVGGAPIGVFQTVGQQQQATFKRNRQELLLPEEVADNMKKYGGFIPGIRAGKPTSDYLQYVLNRLTLPGSIYLGLIALIPFLSFAQLGVSNRFIFGGTSLLIMVGVGLDTVKQIESQLQQRSYEGFLK